MNSNNISPKIKAALIMFLCLALLASGLIGAAIAKYISSITGSSSTNVAVWSIEVNDQQVASSETQTFTFNLYDTLYEEDCVTPETHVSAGVIAPGTGGAFTIKIENLSQVDAEFTLMLTENNEDNIPIQYSTDPSTWHDDLSSLRYLFTEFFLERETGVASKTVYWRWCYIGSDTSHLGQTDDTDTALGLLALTEDVTLTITADLAVSQYLPRPEAPAQNLLASAEITETSITLKAIDGAEYSMDGITWQDSPTFTGLTPGTEYICYARYKETADDRASNSSSIKLTTAVTYTDFIITAENRAKVGYTGVENEVLVIPEVFLDEEDQTWYRVVGIEGGEITSTDEGLSATSAFGATKIAGVTIPNSVTFIGDYAFAYCPLLAELDLGEGVETIGSYAFSLCGIAIAEEGSSLSPLTIPDSVITIEDHAFDWCAVSNLDLGEGVQTIGDYAFNGCALLQSVIIPDSVITIGEYAFFDCYNITELDLGEGVQHIGSQAFNAEGIDNHVNSFAGHLIIPNSVKTIGNFAFSAFDNVNEITFGAQIESIGTNAFDTMIAEIVNTTIHGGNSVVYAHDWAGDHRIPDFASCTIDELLVETTVQNTVYVAGMDFNASGIVVTASYAEGFTRTLTTDEYTLLNTKSLAADQTEVTVSYTSANGTTTTKAIPIKVQAEYDITYFSPSHRSLIGFTDQKTHIYIPETVLDADNERWIKFLGFNSTGDYWSSMGAFHGCTNLESVSIPNSFTDMGTNTFRGCTNLTSINIPASVTGLGKYVFEDCTNLQSVTIPSGVTGLGDSTFKNCTSLESIIIPEGVKNLGTTTFQGCTGLKSVTIPSSVATVGNFVFYNCTSLTDITFHDGITSIGVDAFYVPTTTATTINGGNDAVFAYDWAGDNRTLNATAFTVTADNRTEVGYTGTDGENLVIPAYFYGEDNVLYTVTGIDSAAFQGCKTLASVTLPDTINAIGSNAFQGCSNMTSINIPSSLTTINEYTFQGCYCLESITIPASVETIGANAFESDTSLSSVVIPKTSCLVSIGDKAFYDCYSLGSIVLPVSITSIGKNALDTDNSITVYYRGTETQWNAITITNGMNYATLQYNYTD